MDFGERRYEARKRITGMEFRQHYLENARFEFQRMKGLAERAMEQTPSADGFHFELDEASNSIAVLIQHLSGNMVSRGPTS